MTCKSLVFSGSTVSGVLNPQSCIVPVLVVYPGCDVMGVTGTSPYQVPRRRSDPGPPSRPVNGVTSCTRSVPVHPPSRSPCPHPLTLPTSSMMNVILIVLLTGYIHSLEQAAQLVEERYTSHLAPAYARDTNVAEIVFGSDKAFGVEHLKSAAAL